jgi:hypothetical protein
MISNTMEYLIRIFERAKELNVKYVAVLIEMDGFPKAEIIINQVDNVDTKLDYYKKTYDDELNHKFAKGIRIVGFTFGDSFEEIENELVG